MIEIAKKESTTYLGTKYLIIYFGKNKWTYVYLKWVYSSLKNQLQIGTATMENSMEVPQKTKNRVAI